MAYDSSEVGSLRFLAGNLIFQLTKRVLGSADDGSDIDALDDGSLMMDVITSYYTETDDSFRKEWASIQAERDDLISDGYIPGTHRDQDIQLRFKELKAMFRSLCRKGVFVYQEPEESEWDIKL